MVDTLLIASGPNLAPTLKDAPVSNGTPTIAMSTPSVVWIFGRRMNVLMPENLGYFRGSIGQYLSIKESLTTQKNEKSIRFYIYHYTRAIKKLVKVLGE
jgi:hypothetical protein